MTIDYKDALTKAVQWFDANKCGNDVKLDNVFSSWRGPCHTQDGSTVSLDFTGGFHDAGDHVKFGLPQCWSAATLWWALYEYKSVFDGAGITTKMLSTLKYFTDYFLKCHPSANVFWYLVGDGGADHGYWGPPESQTGTRPVRTCAARLGFLMYELLSIDTFVNTGNLIMDYCLGSNPRSASYVTNCAPSGPQHPHHHAKEPAQGGPTHGMVGALVGGPSDDDSYKNDVGDYTHNEVAIDYNAAFILGLAGRAFFAGGGEPNPTDVPTPTPDPTPTPVPVVGDV